MPSSGSPASLVGPTPARPEPAGRRSSLIFCGALAVVASALTVLRDTADYLRADGIMQSIMSVQDVDLFFWGQNRFASVVPFLTQFIADPSANLIACLLINALAFHGLLLLVAWRAALGLGADRPWPALAVIFGLLTAVAHAVLTPQTVFTYALDTQPYSLSWVLALGCVLLWPTRPIDNPPRCLIAGLMAGLAMGLNPSVLIGVGTLMVVRVVRCRRALGGMAVLGIVWVGWLLVWRVLSALFGGTAGPVPDAPQDYFTWSSQSFAEGWPRAWQSVAAAVNPLPFLVLTVVAGLALIVVPPSARAWLGPRVGVAVAFAALYVLVFTGNPWVAANLYGARYYFPVVVLVPVALALPPAAVIARFLTAASSAEPAHAAARSRTLVAAGLTVLAAVAALTGPLTRPSASIAFGQTRDAYEFADRSGIHFIAGDYWDVWPVVHQGLAQGRTAMFGVTFKSGGDPAEYQARFRADLAGGGTSRAICLDQTADYCALFLDYWTAPGWTAENTPCPSTGSDPVLGEQQEKSCRVLRFTGAGPAATG